MADLVPHCFLSFHLELSHLLSVIDDWLLLMMIFLAFCSFGRIRSKCYQQFVIQPVINYLHFVSFSLVEDHSGEKPTEEFQIHRRKEQERSNQPIIVGQFGHIGL